MKNTIFDKVQVPKVGASRFDLTHDKKLSFKMGRLVPTCVMEVLPGDKFLIQIENFLRFAPLVSPVMHEILVDTFCFFVPNRLLWAEWDEWITQNSAVEHPYIQQLANDPTGLLADYLGYPQGGATVATTKVSPFPIAAYDLIYDEWFIHQDLSARVFSPLLAGDNNAVYAAKYVGALKYKAWNKDYFTSCLPHPQKGANPVLIPFDREVELTDYTNKQKLKDSAGVDLTASSGSDYLRSGTGVSNLYLQGANQDAYIDPNGTLNVDASGEGTILAFRRAAKLQEWLERDARGGIRYKETIVNHFDTWSSDARLQRPEYIGGATQRMVISEVLSTAQTIDQSSNDVPIGQMAGHGISVGRTPSFQYSANEHGWILNVTVVRPVTAYHQGVPRSYLRQERLDYAWPTFAHIGEQEVKNIEVYAEHTTPDGTFGYIPRYSEYRFMNSSVHGNFRKSLNYWHYGRTFTTDPTLSHDFTHMTQLDNRIFADTSGDHIFAHIINRVSAIRKLPKYSNPML